MIGSAHLVSWLVSKGEKTIARTHTIIRYQLDIELLISTLIVSAESILIANCMQVMNQFPPTRSTSLHFYVQLGCSSMCIRWASYDNASCVLVQCSADI